NVDAGRVRIERTRTVVAMVWLVIPSPLAYRAAQLDQFVVVGIHRGRIRQSRGQADGAIRHSLSNDGLHVLELLVARTTIVQSHYFHPAGAVANQTRHVRRHIAVESSQVVGHRSPTPIDDGRLTVPGLELLAQWSHNLVR